MRIFKYKIYEFASIVGVFGAIVVENSIVRWVLFGLSIIILLYALFSEEREWMSLDKALRAMAKCILPEDPKGDILVPVFKRVKMGEDGVPLVIIGQKGEKGFEEINEDEECSLKWTNPCEGCPSFDAKTGDCVTHGGCDKYYDE